MVGFLSLFVWSVLLESAHDDTAEVARTMTAIEDDMCAHQAGVGSHVASGNFVWGDALHFSRRGPPLSEMVILKTTDACRLWS